MAEFAGKTKVVFVGNLASRSIPQTFSFTSNAVPLQPYDATEQEVQKVFEVAGPVKSFRHVFDRDNNKAKGFGGY
jgi:RNA recognition motif-containing protein